MLTDIYRIDPGSGSRLWLALLLYGSIVIIGMLVNLMFCLRPNLYRINWNQRVQILQNRPWQWGDLGYIVLILLIVQTATFLIIRHVLPVYLGYEALPTATVGFIIQIILFDALGLMLSAVLLHQRTLCWRSAFGAQSQSLITGLRLGLYSYAAFMPLVFFASLAFFILLTYWGCSTTMQDVAVLVMLPRHPALQVFVIIMTVLIAPLFEEILFRGIALPLFARRVGIGPAILITSLLFAAIHFHLPSFAPLFVIAVGFSMAYLYSGSLVAPVVMHALFNGVNLMLLWLLNPSNP